MLVKILLVVGTALLLSACSEDAITRLAYETGKQYVCNTQEPNLPDRVRQCQENAQSYEEYKAARAQMLSRD